MKPSPLTIKALKLIDAVRLADYAVYLCLRSRRLGRRDDAAAYLEEARFWGRDVNVQRHEYTGLFVSVLNHAATAV